MANLPKFNFFGKVNNSTSENIIFNNGLKITDLPSEYLFFIDKTNGGIVENIQFKHKPIFKFNPPDAWFGSEYELEEQTYERVIFLPFYETEKKCLLRLVNWQTLITILLI